ncbi:hypothetical protein ABPG73_022745 [Tetrahymena malaccensis]
MGLTFKSQRIIFLLLAIIQSLILFLKKQIQISCFYNFQGLKYTYASPWIQDCQNVGISGFNNQYSFCIINSIISFQQSDVNVIQQYVLNDDCLNVIDLDGNGSGSKFLSGPNCYSNREIQFSYTSPQVIFKAIFEIVLLVKIPLQSSFKLKADINSQVYISSTQYQNYNNSTIQQINDSFQIDVNSNQLIIKVTPIDSQIYSGSTYIQGVFLVAQLVNLIIQFLIS